MTDKEIVKFFEDAVSSIDLYDVMLSFVTNKGIFSEPFEYSDPNLQLIYEVIES